MRSTSARLLLPDTNVLVYETVEDSEHHSEAVSIIDSAKRILLPSLVLHEYVWVMTRALSVSPGLVARKVREYVEDPRVDYVAEPPTAIIEALELVEEGLIPLREVNDAIIMLTAKAFNAVLATFDKKLKKLAERFSVPVVP